jgi:hypothetical protein
MVLDFKVRSSISQRRKFTIQDLTSSHRGFILAEDDGGNKSTNSTTSPKRIQLVIALRDEDRLCLIHEEDGESHEPKIICSMGLVGKNK